MKRKSKETKPRAQSVRVGAQDSVLHKPVSVDVCGQFPEWEFPKIRGTFLGVPIIRIVVYWVYSGVPLFMETAK